MTNGFEIEPDLYALIKQLSEILPIKFSNFVKQNV